MMFFASGSMLPWQRVPAAGMVPETPFCGAFLLTA